ncbi:hypothetical protein QM480_18480 [Flectobacillus sp. DC10W]|uniref:Uncharacterized protein n=1 Tax=Flectobacillus longus TaxID=2984207 RepID=A0ABT6YRY0_9BACT|nr:hypothetical protein [Flectobacillus longus]MDI9866333.1 hypothetical protein [Flectobacillus longus]
MDKYCKLYIDTSDKSVITKSIHLSLDLLKINELDIFYYIDSNDEGDKEKAMDTVYGFLFFPYVVELDSDIVSLSTLISFIKNVLFQLENNNIKVVASCDYENELI